jgi:16S rRNA (cytosine967-C5)-methyltransferase
LRQPSARSIALRVFLEWESSKESADAILKRCLPSGEGPNRERALVHELVWGVFRWRGRLDWQLGFLLDRPLGDLERSVLWILRLGLYQLEHLDRVPPHAAVDTSVELVKRFSKGAAGFVNAVLRRAPDKLASIVEPDAAEDPIGHLVARTSHPAWLLTRWLERYGFRKTLELAAANNEKPSLTLRVVSERVDREDLIAELAASGVTAHAGCLLPDYVHVPGGWHPRLAEFLKTGLCVVHDEASGLVSHLARPSRGATILDVCAAPGGKAIHLASLCGQARVVAADRSLGRLRLLRTAASRVSAIPIHPLVCDGRRPATLGGFSRVLVDAPCTNTGVLGKRPDARWRRTPEDLPRLAKLQGELLDAARGQVRSAGLLVYSTCSLEPEENEDVIRAFLDRHRTDALAEAAEVLPDGVVSGPFLRTDPTQLPLDGIFGAAIRPGGGLLRVVA